MIPQTIGQWRLRRLVPADIELPDTMDKKGIRNMFLDLAQKHPDKYVSVLKAFNDEARDAATRKGGITSLSVRDLETPQEVRMLQQQVAEGVEKIKQDPSLSGQEKQKRITDYMQSRSEQIQKTVLDATVARKNSLGLAAKHGFRGNPQQLTQLFFGDMLLTDHKKRVIPIAAVHGYNQGVTPLEYLAGAYGSRRGYWSVQHATAMSGYEAKQWRNMAHRLVVTGADCGANTVGIKANGDDPDNIGSVLAMPVNGISAGTTLAREDLPKLAGKNIRLRSVITCKQPEGVCQKCAGLRDGGKLPEIGAYIGVDSASLASEPLTQAALSEKHTGGVATGVQKEISGLPEIMQFFNVPEHFRGAAALAHTDGPVKSIKQAPQGGWMIQVGDAAEPAYVPGNRNLLVKQGDELEAGDALSSGTPNPKELVEYKGLGAGRAYFLKQLGQIFEENGLSSPRKHLEVLTRGFLDRVRVSGDEPLYGYLPGDVVPYSALEKQYRPRKDALPGRPRFMAGKYLEKPVLHYTVGTRITPSVWKDLEEADVKEVVAHTNPPAFTPHVSRAMDILATDPDWQTRLGGFNIHKSFLQSATEGAESDPSGTSYVPRLIKPTEL